MNEHPSLATPFEGGRLRSYTAGEVILYEGDASDSMYRILSGQVEVLLEDEEQGDLILSLLGEGEIFGEMSLFSRDNQRCAIVRAVTDTRVHVCDSKRFVAEAGRQHGLWIQLVEQLANRLRDTNRRYSDRAFHSVKARVAHILVELAEKQGRLDGGGPALANVTRTDLGRFASCTREAAGQAVLDLVEEGLVTAAGRNIQLHDLAALRDYS